MTGEDALTIKNIEAFAENGIVSVAERMLGGDVNATLLYVTQHEGRQWRWQTIQTTTMKTANTSPTISTSSPTRPTWSSFSG